MRQGHRNTATDLLDATFILLYNEKNPGNRRFLLTFLQRTRQPKHLLRGIEHYKNHIAVQWIYTKKKKNGLMLLDPEPPAILASPVFQWCEGSCQESGTASSIAES